MQIFFSSWKYKCISLQQNGVPFYLLYEVSLSSVNEKLYYAGSKFLFFSCRGLLYPILKIYSVSTWGRGAGGIIYLQSSFLTADVNFQIEVAVWPLRQVISSYQIHMGQDFISRSCLLLVLVLIFCEYEDFMLLLYHANTTSRVVAIFQNLSSFVTMGFVLHRMLMVYYTHISIYGIAVSLMAWKVLPLGNLIF